MRGFPPRVGRVARLGRTSAIHLAGDRLRRDDGRSLLLQLRQMVFERLRLRLERLQVDLDLRQQEVEGVNEGDRRSRVRNVEAGFCSESHYCCAAPPTLVQ